MTQLERVRAECLEEIHALRRANLEHKQQGAAMRQFVDRAQAELERLQVRP